MKYLQLLFDFALAIITGWSAVSVYSHYRSNVPRKYRHYKLLILCISIVFLVASVIYNNFSSIRPYLCNRYYDCRTPDEIVYKSAKSCMNGKCTEQELRTCVLLLYTKFPHSAYISDILADSYKTLDSAATSQACETAQTAVQLPLCEQKSYFNNAKANGIAGLNKFREECKASESLYYVRAWQDIQELKKNEYGYAEDCLREENCNVIQCLSTYLSDNYDDHSSVSNLLDVVINRVNVEACTFGGGKHMQDLVTHYVECGFELKDIEIEVENVSSGVEIKLTTVRKAIEGFNFEKQPKWCKALRQLPVRDPAHGDGEPNESSFGEGIDSTHIDQKTLVNTTSYPIRRSVEKQ